MRVYCGRLVASILCPEFFRVTKRGARSNLPASLRERTQSQTEKGRRRKSTLQADRSIYDSTFGGKYGRGVTYL